jgi:hypothetical protein
LILQGAGPARKSPLDKIDEISGLKLEQISRCSTNMAKGRKK